MIASRAEKYICEALGISGFVVLNAQIAYVVRRDLWSGALIAQQDFVWNEVENFVKSIPRVTIYEVRFVGSEDTWTPVAARSEDSLADRVGWLVGMDVAAVRPYTGRRVAEAKERHAPEEDKPPSHQCTARAEWFEKRGLADPEIPKKQPPKRIYG